MGNAAVAALMLTMPLASRGPGPLPLLPSACVCPITGSTPGAGVLAKMKEGLFAQTSRGEVSSGVQGGE